MEETNNKVRKLRVYKSNALQNGSKKRIVKIAALVTAAAIGLVTLTACNMEVIDTTYGFGNAVMLNDGNTVIIPVDKWKDYNGEAVQMTTTDGMAVLTSSYFTDLINGKSSHNLAITYAEKMTDKEGTMSYYDKVNEKNSKFNYQLIDLQYNFDKAIIIQNNRAVIIPVAKWKDYNGEQIQIITPESVVLLASNYNTILVSDNRSERKAIDLARMLVGENGLVTDFAGNFVNSNFNKQIFDLKFAFNKALALGDKSDCILPLDSWTDYDDGEQFQLKVMDGPTYVCSSFNTILINDVYGSEITTEKLANALNEKVVNYAEGKEYKRGSFNKQIIDLDYNFQNAAITNGQSSVVLPLDNWCDYDGEQLQFGLKNGVTVLSSSIDSGMTNHNTKKITIDDISKGLVEEGKSKNIDPQYENGAWNKLIFDTKYSFPYALVVTDESILILSVDNWRDYAGGEQLQITLSDKVTTLLTTAYDTKLVNLGNSNLSIEEVAAWFNDGNKKVVNLSDHSNNSGKHWNWKLFDTQFTFNYALSINGDVATIIPIEKWIDYDGNKDSEGDYTDYTEQLQITLQGNDKIYSDNTNIKLIYSTDPEIVELIASGHVGPNGTVNYLTDSKEYVKK